MPASSTIPNAVQVRLLWNLGGAGAVNVLHAIAPAGFVVNQSTCNTLGAAIKSQYTSTWAVRNHTTVQLVRVGLRDRRTPNTTEFLDAGAAVSGTSAAGDILPAQNALCITLRTALSGKSYRGRIYLGGMTENENSVGGVVGSATEISATGFLTGISSAMTASGLTLAVASRGADASVVTQTTTHQDGSTSEKVLYRIKDKSAAANAVTVIQSRGVNMETQRRRNNGRGVVPTIFNPEREIHLPGALPAG